MEKKQKLGLVINSIESGGGAERVASMLASRFASSSYEMHLICIYEYNVEYPIDEKVKRHNMGGKMSNFRPLAMLQRVIKLRRICKRERFDVLIGFMIMSEYVVMATYGLKTKSVISIRNNPSSLYPNLIKRLYARLLLSKADGAVFQTEDAKRWFPIRLQKKSKVIFNPIGERFYNVERNVVHGLLVASGRLHPQKNYPMMFKAIAQVLKNRDIILEIYGKGQQEQYLKDAVKTIGIEEQVRFCGQSEDIPSVLSRADLFLMSSDYEGLPNGLMEAMAVGVPSVSTDCPCGGPRMLLGNNERGFLVPLGDSNAMAEAIMKLLDSPELKEQISKKAKEYAGQFSVDNCYLVWENHIKQFFS